MALYLKVRDNRWQFSFGSKYMVIADVVADPSTTAVAGGTPFLVSSMDPQVKSSRAPWFAAFNGQNGITAAYVPSDFGAVPNQTPSTVLANANTGKLQVFQDGVEFTGDLSTILTPQGALQGMFIFQGME